MKLYEDKEESQLGKDKNELKSNERLKIEKAKNISRDRFDNLSLPCLLRDFIPPDYSKWIS